MYSMSALGDCPKALAAQRLGYEPLPAPDWLEIAAQEGRDHEPLIARYLTETQKLSVVQAGPCEKGCDREGFHVELEANGILLAGHVDAYIGDKAQKQEYVGEFKALNSGRARSLNAAILNGRFAKEFYGYALQISAYHYATGKPIMYVVKDRGTGFVKTHMFDPPFSLEEIVERITTIETQVQDVLANSDALLPKCEMNKFRRDSYCPYSFLHEEEPRGIMTPAGLAENIAEYREATRLKEEADERLSAVKAILFADAQASDGQLYQDGFKVTVVPERESIYYPKANVDKLPKDLRDKLQAVKKTKAFIRVEDSGGS